VQASEEIFFQKVTTGASDDLRKVTQIVYSMIQLYGMNDRIGNLSFPKQVRAQVPRFLAEAAAHVKSWAPVSPWRWRYDLGRGTVLISLPLIRQEGGMGLEQRPYSESTAQAMDEEAKKLVDEAYKRTLDLLRDRREQVRPPTPTALGTYCQSMSSSWVQLCQSLLLSAAH
jgi:AFG3 family protein